MGINSGICLVFLSLGFLVVSKPLNDKIDPQLSFFSPSKHDAYLDKRANTQSNQSNKTRDAHNTGVQLTVKEFQFPSADTDQCYRVVYSLQLPSFIVEMLRSNESVNIDQLKPLLTPFSSGAERLLDNLFEGLNAQFFHRLLEFFSHRLRDPLPEFEIMKSELAQSLGIKPIIVRVKEMELVNEGYLVTAYLCSQPSGSNVVLEDHGANRMTKAPPIYKAVISVYSPPSTSNVNADDTALPLTSSAKKDDHESDGFGWPQVCAIIIIMILIFSVLACFYFC